MIQIKPVYLTDDDVMHGWTENRTMNIGKANAKKLLAGFRISQSNPYLIARLFHFEDIPSQASEQAVTLQQAAYEAACHTEIDFSAVISMKKSEDLEEAAWAAVLKRCNELKHYRNQQN